MSTEAIEARLAMVGKGQLAMVQVAQDRLAAAIGALLAGDFDAAWERTIEAQGKLDVLKDAQRAFTRLAEGAEFKLAPELAEGMTIIGWGKLTEVGVAESVVKGSPTAYRLKWIAPDGSEHDRVIGESSELIVFPEGVEPGE